MSKRLPFVGRVVETNRCLRYLDKSVGAREPKNILVTGQRGIGKTRFIEEILPRARAKGFNVIAHRCQKWDRHTPFSVIAALVRALLGRPPQWSPRNSETLEKLVRQVYPDVEFDQHDSEILCWLLGSPDAGRMSREMDEKSRRAVVAGAFDRFVESGLERRPSLLIVLDDIHHGDEFSANYILTSAFPAGVVLMLSTVTIDLLALRIECDHIELRALDEEKVEALLKEYFGASFSAQRYASAVTKITGGNPLHISQLLPEVKKGAGAAESLERALHEAEAEGPLEAALKRLDSLDRYASRLLKAASLIADSFPLPIAKYMVGQRFPITAAMRGLRSEGLAASVTEGKRKFFRFRHGIIREAAQKTLDEIESEELHLAAAEAIKRYYGRVNERYLIQAAHHYAEAGDRKNAVDCYMRAGDYLFRMGDLNMARDAFEAARDFTTDREQKLSAWLGMITVLSGRGEVQKCIGEIRAFLEESPPPTLESRAMLRLSRLHTMAGSIDKGYQTALKAFDLVVQTEDKVALGMAASYVAFALSQKGDVEQARKYARLGLKVVKNRTDSTQVEAGMLHTLGVVDSNEGKYGEARREFEESAEIYEQIGHLYNSAAARVNLALVYKSTGRLQDAYEQDMAAIEFFDKVDAKAPACLVRYNTASLLILAGDLNAAFSILEEASKIAIELDSKPLKGAVMLTRGVCRVKMGLFEEGLVEVEKGYEIRLASGRTKDEADVAEVRVEVALLNRDVETALAESDRILKKMRGNKIRDFHLKALVTRIEALIAAGEIGEVRKVGEELETLVLKDNNPFNLACAFAALSRIETISGKIQRSLELLARAEKTKAIPREEMARTFLAIADSLLDRGKMKQSAEYFRDARENYLPLVEHGYRKTELEYIEGILEGIK